MHAEKIVRESESVANPVVVIDGPGEPQSFVDAVVAHARAGGGDLPHSHPNIPAARITVAQLNAAVFNNFAINGMNWVVADSGYPPVTAPASVAAPDPNEEPPPNRGSAMHNLLHSLLGNFH